MDFSDSEGIVRATEKCNGSGDCRKTHKMPGAMCPSYHVTREEKDTTRGRANTLREFLTATGQENRFDRPELKAVFDLCLSCKACASECPSNVDVATLKSEFLYQYQEANGYSFRNKLFAYNTYINRLGSILPGFTNAVYRSPLLSGMIKRISGVSPNRRLPDVSRFNFAAYLKSKEYGVNKDLKRVVLYIDEFTQYLDTDLGRDAIDLLTRLGYEVRLFFGESGRTFISKGFLKQAKQLAKRNMVHLQPLMEQGWVFLGLEPSAILTFRDEYRRLGLDIRQADLLAANSLLMEEFLAGEIGFGNLLANHFTREARTIKIHNHCHQKALSDQKVTFDLLNLPTNYTVSIINSGCCGMAGSFGYEAEHYDISMKIGEQRLFSAINKMEEGWIIAANGTSCRQQIKDGTGRVARHPVSILKEALIAD